MTASPSFHGFGGCAAPQHRTPNPTETHNYSLPQRSELVKDFLGKGDARRAGAYHDAACHDANWTVWKTK